MEKMDFSSILESFGIPLTLYAKPEVDGHYVAGEWQKIPYIEWEHKEINEPFLPSSIAVRLAYGQGGFYERNEMIWFSKEIVPMKSVIVNHGLAYSVEESVPYTDYSNVTQYGVKAVSSNE